MCLVHDLGEAYDGDIPAVAQMADGTKEAAELAAMDKLTRMLRPRPERQSGRYGRNTKHARRPRRGG